MISVIVPVYNIEKKVSKFKCAVDSVLNQSYRDLELIIVNDGSVDNTGRILNKVQQSDCRVKIFTKENEGVESARRYGLEHANGEYVIHMDQDDMYRKDAFDFFARKMAETGADIVVANHTRFFYSRHLAFGKYHGQSMKVEKIIDHDTFMKQYYISFFGINNLPVNIWNKMYRKTFLDSSPMPPRTGHIIEDLSYNMHIFPYARKIALIPDVLYYYRWGGYTNHYDATVLETAIIGYSLKMKLIKKYALSDFKASTAIELLNYLNTYFSQIVEYEIEVKNGFEAEVERVLSLPEVHQALNIVRSFNRYHTDYIDAMLSCNTKDLYMYELNEKKRNSVKLFLKNILLRV